MSFGLWESIATMTITSLICGFIVSLWCVSYQNETVVGDPTGTETIVSQEFTFKGARACADCHLTPGTRALTDADGFKVTDFVSMNEFEIWFENDVHAVAFLRVIPDKAQFDRVNKQFATLGAVVRGEAPFESRLQWGPSNELSAQICEKLGIDTSAFNSAKQCLSCHANFREQDTELDMDVQQYGVGVTCEACHGAASDWFEPHDKEAWRLESPETKDSQNMIDVRNPLTRAEQCFSCHIGNRKEGKIITHEMYAAGHPPLPSIEIESFANQMPRHWRLMNDKGEFRHRVKFAELNGWREGDYSASKAVVLGAIAAAHHWTDMVAQQALNGSPHWPEFAMFDCLACHHDLRSDSWRQQRGFTGKPGRPPLPYWPNALLKVGLIQTVDDPPNALDQLQSHQNQLQGVLDAQPFGLAGDLASSRGGVAKSFAEWLHQILKQHRSQAFDRDDAKLALELLCGKQLYGFDINHEIRDYHSARQIAWAIRTIYNELKVRSDGAIPAEAKFESVLRQISDMMMLDLPNVEITENRQKSANSIAAFEPSAFIDLLNHLNNALQE